MATAVFLKYLPRLKEYSNPRDGTKIVLRQFINCRSKGIIFVGTYNCSKLYVGKSIKEFRRQISKHLNLVRNGEDTPIVRHLTEFYGDSLNDLKFWGLSHVKLGSRRGNLDRKLLQEAAMWIYSFDTLKLNALNEGFSFTLFI